MLDVGHLPASQPGADIQIFTRPCTADSLQMETWRKPRGKTMCFIFAIGGGGGGGGGFTGVATSARGGGGSGGSGGIVRLLIPVYTLPDILYIQVGAGGQGVGSGGGTAGSGISTFVTIAPNVGAGVGNTLFRTDNGAPPTGGGTGTAAAVGAAGAAGGLLIASSGAAFHSLGIIQALAGVAGVAGGAVAGANGTAAAQNTSGACCWPGSGGAGTTSADFAGGAFTLNSNSYMSEQRPATPAAGSFNGSGGPQFWKPFFSFGGGGGSASNAGVGGNGGNGATGAGGGGGGGGTTGGRGGDGGTGIVMIYCW